ncbi:MAG: DinB family protein [Fimbriimonadaceae bacterium]
MTEIEAAKQRAVSAMEMFLRNFSKVPDERLHWQAAPGAKTPLRIAAHTAVYAARFAAMMETRDLPQPGDLDAWLAAREQEERGVTSREEVEAAFRAGTERVLAAMDALEPEDLDAMLDSGQGWQMPMRFLVDLPAIHANLHCGQIDFLQTCWGDQDVYVD